jgi:hypothetical protein
MLIAYNGNSLMSIAQLVGHLHIICRDRGSNPGTSTYSPLRVKFKPLNYLTKTKKKLKKSIQRQYVNNCDKVYIYDEIEVSGIPMPPNL